MSGASFTRVPDVSSDNGVKVLQYAHGSQTFVPADSPVLKDFTVSAKYLTPMQITLPPEANAITSHTFALLWATNVQDIFSAFSIYTAANLHLHVARSSSEIRCGNTLGQPSGQVRAGLVSSNYMLSEGTTHRDAGPKWSVISWFNDFLTIIDEITRYFSLRPLFHAVDRFIIPDRIVATQC